jgi:hypothetical protein
MSAAHASKKHAPNKITDVPPLTPSEADQGRAADAKEAFLWPQLHS